MFKKVDWKSDRTLVSYSPAGDLKISDFCDMQQFDQILKDWANSTGLASVAVDKAGNYLNKGHNFTDFCQKLIRQSPEGLRRCIECDRNGVGTYYCHAGLYDFVAPITLEDGTFLGKVFGGQVLTELPDENRLRAAARELGIDEERYIDALHKVNIRSKEAIQAAADMLANIINLFVRISYMNHMKSLSLSERFTVIESLSKIYFCAYYISVQDDEFLELDTTEALRAISGDRGQASNMLRNMAELLADAKELKDLLRFTSLATLGERTRHRQLLTFEFLSPREGWCRAAFIVAGRDCNQCVTHVIYTLQHIQEEKENELQIRENLMNAAQAAEAASRAKSEFLSNMSHDIRTPLNGIIGITYLTRKMDLPQEAKVNLDKIEKSSQFLLRLINDVLDMAKAESGKIELRPEPYTDTEFGEYISAVIEPLCTERRQSFIYEPVCIVEEWVPLFDKLRINQVVLNLLSNAVKYTPEGGVIRYRVSESMLPDNRMAMHVEVVDNGIGMSQEFQTILFDSFTQEHHEYQTERHGSGLGLAITKKLVEAMGGTISVKSGLGQGSTFSIDFELACVPSARGLQDRTELSDSDDLTFIGKHVLLCEDHPLNQEIAKAVLEEKGFVVTIAENGLVGTQVFEKSPIGYFDCILMDIHMPVMEGYEATKAIRAMERADAQAIPIIAITADAFDEDVQKCLDAGMNGHIAKPIEPTKLCKVIADFLR